MATVPGLDIQRRKYTKFILELVNEITTDIFDKLKYALRYDIPKATMEKLRKPLDLFKELEKSGIVGPDDFDRLRDFLEMINEQQLVSMLDSFARSRGISPSTTAIAKQPLKNYLMMDGYYLHVKGAQHYNNEAVGEYVELTNGSSYALVIKNIHFHRCRCTIKIDGHIVFPGAVINPRQSITIEHPWQRDGQFKFYSIEHAPTGSGINKWKSENGLVEATFTPERADMIIACRVSNGDFRTLTCSSETTDVALREMILSVFHFDETMAVSVHFRCKPIGQRNIKLTAYGLRNCSEVEIKLGLVGGGFVFLPPSVIPPNENNNGAPNWVPGATTLQAGSEQTSETFDGNSQSDDFVLDRAKSTTLYLRLVARAGDHPPTSSGEYTPLAKETLIPPPVVKW